MANSSEGNRLPDSKPLSHYESLDGLRGAAVVAVIVFHCFASTGSTFFDQIATTLTQPLWSGVELFFALSGFLITGILIDTRDHPHYFRNFLARRFVRIFPLYYGVLLALFVLLPLLGFAFPAIGKLLNGEAYVKLWDGQFWLWTYLQNFYQGQGPHQLPGLGHFWTLAIEEQFYVVWPFLIFLVPRRWLTRIIIGYCIALLFLRPLLLSVGADAWGLRYNTFARADNLLFGALAAIALRDNYWRQCWMQYSRSILVACLAYLVAVRLMTGDLKFTNEHIVGVGFTVLGIMFSTMILMLCVAEKDRTQPRVFTASYLRKIGKYSYAIYLFHFPIVHAVRILMHRTLPENSSTRTLQNILLTGIVFVIAYCCAWTSWHLYEVHWLRLKKYFPYS